MYILLYVIFKVGEVSSWAYREPTDQLKECLHEERHQCYVINFHTYVLCYDFKDIWAKSHTQHDLDSLEESRRLKSIIQVHENQDWGQLGQNTREDAWFGLICYRSCDCRNTNYLHMDARFWALNYILIMFSFYLFQLMFVLG